MGVVEGGVVKEGEVGDVSKFLNRILGLKVHQQNLVCSGHVSIVLLKHKCITCTITVGNVLPLHTQETLAYTILQRVKVSRCDYACISYSAVCLLL